MRKLTTDEFVARSKAVHPGKFRYGPTKYINAGTKLIIECIIHGDIVVSPADHINKGYGCRHCSVEAARERYSDSMEDFLRKSKEVHSDTYDYSLVELKGSKDAVQIICKHHKPFWQAPSMHYAGQGCPDCGIKRSALGRRLSKEEFIERSLEVHKGRYSYELVDFTDVASATDKVIINCKAHGPFSQTITDHLHAGAGCSKCCVYGFKGSLPGKFYIMSSGSITKIGITNLEVSKRQRDLYKSWGQQFSVDFWVNFQDGYIANDVETNMLRKLRKEYKSVSSEMKSDGYTECFIDVDHTKLMSDIIQEIQTNFKLKE